MNIKTVYIEITNRCNLNCRTCYNRSGLNRQTQEISVRQIQAILDTLSRYGARRFLFSGGEPSLHSEFHALLELTEQYPDYSFGFVTNGTNADPVFIDYLNTHKNVTLQISLDGASEEQNCLTRGAGNFEKAVSFAKQIQNPHIKPLLKMVVSKANLHGVEDFYRLAVSLGFVPEYAAIYKSGNATDKWDAKALSPQEKLKMLKTIRQLNEASETKAYLPRSTYTCPFVSDEHKDLSVCIKPDGSIQPCQSLYDAQFTLCNAFSFDEAAFTEGLARITAQAKARAAADLGCGKCMLKDICGRGCMAAAHLTSGSVMGDDGDCTYRKLLILHNVSIREVGE
ncbi:MAG: radical SAM protein [Clostridia bacterium]|nr:radical SAM protein [Clostridia bacterium]